MAFAAFGPQSAVADSAPKKRSWIALFLLAPGIAYMLLFFLTPLIQLAFTSLQAPAATSRWTRRQAS
jgi:spermidine/putrescine transport system permease protein